LSRISLLTGVGFLTIFALAISKKKYNLYISPIVVFPISFLYASFLYVLNLSKLYDISIYSVFIILFSIALFIFGGILTLYKQRFNFTNMDFIEYNKERINSKKLYFVILFFFIIGLSSALYQLNYTFKISGANSVIELYTKHFFLIDHGFLRSGVSWLYQLNQLNAVLCFIYIKLFKNRHLIINIIMVTSIALMGLKGDIYYVFIPIMSIGFIFVITGERKYQLHNFIKFSGIAIVAIMFFVTVTYSFYFSQYTFDKFYIYSVGPLIAFDSLIQKDFSENGPQFGYSTLFCQVFNSIEKKIFKIESIQKNERKYFLDIGPNISVNVYTILGNFYKDLGILGTFICAGLLGFVSSIIYEMYISKPTLTRLFFLGILMVVSSAAFFASLFNFIILYFFIVLAFVIQCLCKK